MELSPGSPRVPTGPVLDRFRAGFAGDVVLPSDADYDAARAVWNGVVDRHPALVVRPTGAADVASAVRFARDQDLVVAVRSGGHSIAGLSTCDDGIVIDLSRMRGARVNAQARTARANGGALLAELDRAAQDAGLVCPVGVVGHTGVAGLTLGGGMGRLQRKLGLTIDSLHAVELVTADGQLVRASEQENPELFWGMRGAGPNFGIVTSFDFRLHPFDGGVTHGWVLHPVERLPQVAALFRELAASGPADLTASILLSRADRESGPPEVAGRPFVALSVLHCGTPEAAERDLAAVRALGPPVQDTITRTTYLSTQQVDDEAMAWGHRFYMKSGFLAELTDDVLDVLLQHLDAVPEGGSCSLGAWTWGGAIARVAEDATAFTGRTPAFWVATEAKWDDPARDGAHAGWARSAMADLEPFLSTGRYVNDLSDTGGDVVRSVYGPAKYERLVALKRTWDPDNVFRLNQNVRP
jgi:FAD/FMN-containing dehydrogenase